MIGGGTMTVVDEVTIGGRTYQLRQYSLEDLFDPQTRKEAKTALLKLVDPNRDYRLWKLIALA